MMPFDAMAIDPSSTNAATQNKTCSYPSWQPQNSPGKVHAVKRSAKSPLSVKLTPEWPQFLEHDGNRGTTAAVRRSDATWGSTWAIWASRAAIWADTWSWAALPPIHCTSSSACPSRRPQYHSVIMTSDSAQENARHAGTPHHSKVVSTSDLAQEMQGMQALHHSKVLTRDSA